MLVIGISFAMMSACILWVLCSSMYVPSKAFCEGVGEYSLLAATEKQREDFFLPFGYKAHSLDSYEIKVPSEGEVFEEYNEIQEEQGLDLIPFAGRDARLYVLSLDAGEEGKLFGFMIVYKDKVIGAHTSSCGYPAGVRGLWG